MLVVFSRNFDALPLHLISSHDLMNHRAVHIGELTFEAVVVVAETVEVEAEEVEERAVEFVDAAHAIDGLIAEVVGRAVAEAPLHARSGEPRGEAFRIVIATVGTFLEGGHAAELGDEHDDCVLQQAA